jgi:hypothetical protein
VLTLASLPLNCTGTTTEPSARPSTVTTWEEPGARSMTEAMNVCGLVTTNSADASVAGLETTRSMTPSPLTHATAEVLAVGAALAMPPKPTRPPTAIPVATMSCESFTRIIPRRYRPASGVMAPYSIRQDPLRTEFVTRLGHTAHTWSEVISPNAVHSPHSGHHIVEMLTLQHGALASYLVRVDFQQTLDLGVADTAFAVPRTGPHDDL